jgi:hypothetical protein
VFYVGAGTGESLLKNMLGNDTVANALASPAVPLILDPAEVSSGTANYGFNFPANHPRSTAPRPGAAFVFDVGQVSGEYPVTLGSRSTRD